jgi:hypothetical protein
VPPFFLVAELLRGAASVATHHRPFLVTPDPPRASVILNSLFPLLSSHPRLEHVFDTWGMRLESATTLASAVATLYVDVDRDLEDIRSVVEAELHLPYPWMADVLLFLFRQTVLGQGYGQFVELTIAEQQADEAPTDFQRRLRRETAKYRPTAAGPRKGLRAPHGRRGGYLERDVDWFYRHCVLEPPVPLAVLATEYVRQIGHHRSSRASSTIAKGIKRVERILQSLQPISLFHDGLPKHAGIITVVTERSLDESF